MRNPQSFIFLALAVFSFSCIQLPIAVAETTFGKMAKSVGNAVGDTASAVGNAVGSTTQKVGGTVKDMTSSKSPVQARQEIDAATSKALNRLFREKPVARKLYDISYGYAVFDSRKFSFLLTTGGGAGVAVDKKTNSRTYMKMFSGGVNLGAGVKYFQVVFLFENRKSFSNFVNQGWEASASADATFGKDSLEITPRFVNGLAVYQLNETGIMADLNIAGTKYWRSEDLNRG